MAVDVVVPQVVEAVVGQAEAVLRKRKGLNNGCIKYYLFLLIIS